MSKLKIVFVAIFLLALAFLALPRHFLASSWLPLAFAVKTMALAFLMFGLLSTKAWAHDFWAETRGPDETGRLTVVFGYGHTFPQGDTFTPEFIGHYEPPRLIGPDGDVPLVPGAEPQLFVTKDPLPTGTYVVSLSDKPVFMGETPTGWVRKSKQEEPTVTTCGFGVGNAKKIVNIGGASDDGIGAKPVGDRLELLPLINPNGLKVGQSLPLKVLFDGQDQRRIQVGAFFVGFTPDNSAFAYAATTNRAGVVNITPWKAGVWLAKVTKNFLYHDQTICDREYYTSTVTFTVSE
jgi:uncharacterized GH25 family protein